MTRLFGRFAILFVLVVAGNQLLNGLFFNKAMPYFWGSRDMMVKRHNFLKDKSAYNTLFLGSSKTHYQVIPRIFDSLVNQGTTAGLRSYNFGIDGMFAPEVLPFYDSLLSECDSTVKTLIFELHFVKTGRDNNLFTYRGYYWVTPGLYRDYTRTLIHSRYPVLNKTWSLALFNVRAVENLLNLSRASEYLEFRKSAYFMNDSLGDWQTSGFKALGEQKSFSREALRDIDASKEASIAAFAHFREWSQGPENRYFQADLLRVAERARQKGIRLVFFIPDQWAANQYKELLPLLRRIPEEQKLFLCDYNRYKPLYELGNLYDYSHVNGKGAVIFTTDLAEEFRKIAPARQ